MNKYIPFQPIRLHQQPCQAPGSTAVCGVLYLILSGEAWTRVWAYAATSGVLCIFMDAEENLQEVWVQSKSCSSVGVQRMFPWKYLTKHRSGKMKIKHKLSAGCSCSDVTHNAHENAKIPKQTEQQDTGDKRKKRKKPRNLRTGQKPAKGQEPNKEKWILDTAADLFIKAWNRFSCSRSHCCANANLRKRWGVPTWNIGPASENLSRVVGLQV